MVGSAIWRILESKGYSNLIGKTSVELDLRNQQAVNDFYKQEQPESVIDAAAKVGGILANNDFPYSTKSGIGEDFQFFYEIFLASKKIFVIPEYIFCWRKVQDKSLQINQSASHLSNINARINIFIVNK